VDGWNTEELDQIVTGRRRTRAGKRRVVPGLPRTVWVLLTVVVLLALGAGAAVLWWKRPASSAPTQQADVIEPGGYRAAIQGKDIITLGLQVQSTAKEPVTLVSARILAPKGLNRLALTIVPVGVDNQGFALEGDLPTLSPVHLGTDDASRSAIVAARFKVDCKALLATDAATDTSDSEQIFVTVQIGTREHEEELTPPAVGDLPWLTAAAQRACLDPLPTGRPDKPLPALPGGTESPSASGG
jgi:hypothetical protein